MNVPKRAQEKMLAVLVNGKMASKVPTMKALIVNQ